MLNPTTSIQMHKQKIGEHITLNFFDFPGNFNIKEADPKELEILENAKSIIYLIDVQLEPYKEPIQYFIQIYNYIILKNPKAQVHILIHKTDEEYYGVDERKLDIQKKIKQIINEEIDHLKKQAK